MKKIYGVGTGPGDEELLTLKAVRVMKEASVIFAPKNKGKNMALDTAKNFIKNKRIILLEFPMGKVTIEDYENAAKIIYKEIPKGESGVFLTIGDPMIYSTFIYIIDQLKSNYSEIEIEIVPGIPSFVAAASEIQQPLTIKGDDFLLCDELSTEELIRVDSVAILKTMRNKDKIIKNLDNNGFNYKYVKRVTLDEQNIIEDKEDILKDEDYISLILARKNK